jgi:cytochrome b561
MSDSTYPSRALVAAALIAALVVAHIGGALHHHLVRKDGVLTRMITG